VIKDQHKDFVANVKIQVAMCRKLKFVSDLVF